MDKHFRIFTLSMILRLFSPVAWSYIPLRWPMNGVSFFAQFIITKFNPAHPSTTCSAWEMASPEFLKAEIWHTGVKFPQEFRNDHTFLIKCTMSTGITVIISTVVSEWTVSRGVIMGFKMLLSRWRSRIDMLEWCLAPLVVHWSTKKLKISEIKVYQK